MLVVVVLGTGGLSATPFNVTKAMTQVVIPDSQTIAIGGRASNNFSSAKDEVPYLGYIPLVGKLFGSKNPSTTTTDPSAQKVKTLFFVTVTTVDSQGQPAGAKVDGKNDQSQDDQTQKKTAATDAAPGLKGSEKMVSSGNANKDKPA